MIFSGLYTPVYKNKGSYYENIHDILELLQTTQKFNIMNQAFMPKGQWSYLEETPFRSKTPAYIQDIFIQDRNIWFMFSN